MKRRITIFTLFLTSLIAIGFNGTLFAQTDPLQEACTQGTSFNNSPTCQGRTTGNPILGPDGIITTVAQILVMLVGIIAVIMIIVAGFKYIVSAGDANAAKSAKDTLLYAVIGLVVAVFAQAIVSFVLRQL